MYFRKTEEKAPNSVYFVACGTRRANEDKVYLFMNKGVTDSNYCRVFHRNYLLSSQVVVHHIPNPCSTYGGRRRTLRHPAASTRAGFTLGQTFYSVPFKPAKSAAPQLILQEDFHYLASEWGGHPYTCSLTDKIAARWTR
jgi:hypothetical protein